MRAKLLGKVAQNVNLVHGYKKWTLYVKKCCFLLLLEATWNFPKSASNKWLYMQLKPPQVLNIQSVMISLL